MILQQNKSFAEETSIDAASYIDDVLIDDATVWELVVNDVETKLHEEFSFVKYS